MTLRLIEAYVDEYEPGDIKEILRDIHTLGVWEADVSEKLSIVRVLIDTRRAEKVMDAIDSHYGNGDGFRLVSLGVEATLPRYDVEEEDEAECEEEGEAEEPREKDPQRLACEELVQDVTGQAQLNRTFFLMVAFSTIVAAVGLLRDNVAVIVGAMVIAPLLAPNMALAVGTTLGDRKLFRRALLANASGAALAFALSVVLGVVMRIMPGAEGSWRADQIMLRAAVTYADLALALAAGSAGALAFTTGVSAGLVGVMVAVALLPPLVAAGLLTGAGQFGAAGRAMLLVAANVICVDLAAVLTFVLKGIRPRLWWEQDQARKATVVAVVMCVTLLAALGVVIYFA